MSKLKKRSVVVEAITFDELVEYGISHGANVHDGMPWSFEYQGRPITHENNDCYLIPSRMVELGTVRFNRGDMLITNEDGEIFPCRADVFRETYEPA